MEQINKKYLYMTLFIFCTGLVKFLQQSEPELIVSEVPDKRPPIIEAKVNVHLSGEVNYPGIYYVTPNTIVADLITHAGGATQYANLDSVNLVKPIKAGLKVNIKRHKYAEIQAININIASSIQLQKIPGIGPKLAKRIVLYRQENGSFTSFNQLKNVSGISTKKIRLIRQYIRL